MYIRRPQSSPARHGFTLVELLVVIAIISLLAAITVPVVGSVIEKAKSTAMRAEVGAMESAIEQYVQKYGDYPPDFSDWTVVERHYRKIFPRIAQSDLDLLQRFTDDSVANDSDLMIAISAHDPEKMDRAEALVWALAGFSSNPQLPFTGAGGPLAAFATSPRGFHINTERDNSFYDFDIAKLSYSEFDDSAMGEGYTSTDFDQGTPDLFVNYAATSNGAPYVYFDSRTYNFPDPTKGYNGFNGGFAGLVRPYYSTTVTGAAVTTVQEAIDSVVFMNNETFQIIGPGVDGNFGATAGSPALPVYFQYPTGNTITASATALTAGGKGFQSPGASEHFQLDNVTNFSNSKLVDDVPDGT